ncbi:mutS protein homolog 5-like [Liolophura sinensis]|uniref:mutS protein homolog 5-like n=1 Tax=Liolophura sinensis TaxID=3198878 RepID=UPI00315860FD
MAGNSSSSTSIPYSTGCVTTSTSAGNSGDDTTDPSDLFADHVTTFRRACSAWSDEETSSTDRQVFLSVVWQHGNLGAAYYDIEDSVICMLHDCEESTEFNTLRRVLEQVEPTCIVISARQDNRFRKDLQLTVSEILLGDQTSSGDVIQILPSLDFSLEICKGRIMGLKLPSMPENMKESERLLHLSSLVSFDNICMVQATGGLLKYLEMARIGVELEDPNVKVPLIDLTVFSL